MLAVADLGGRTGKILERFPTFMLAPSPDKVLATVAAGLGHDLDETERLAMGIQRAHRLQAADEAVDILRLAALASLHPADFFILTALYSNRLFAERAVQQSPEPLPDRVREQLGHDAYVDALRLATARMISVLMEGCGTVWALLEGTAALLDADRLGSDGEVDRDARIVESWTPTRCAAASSTASPSAITSSRTTRPRSATATSTSSRTRASTASPTTPSAASASASGSRVPASSASA